MPGYQVHKTTRASTEIVWDIIQDHEAIGLLLPPGSSRLAPPRLVSEGTGDRNGVGAVRAFGRLPLREEITGFEPLKRMTYTMRGGGVRGYEAVIELHPRGDGGTEISWTGSFDRPRGPLGALVARVLGAIVGSMASKVVTTAEVRSV